VSDIDKEVGKSISSMRKRYATKMREMKRIRAELLEEKAQVVKELKQIGEILIAIRDMRVQTEKDRGMVVEKKSRATVLGNFTIALTSILNPKQVLEGIALYLEDFVPENVMEVGCIELIMKLYEEAREKEGETKQ
jgi:hypothetical protein